MVVWSTPGPPPEFSVAVRDFGVGISLGNQPVSFDALLTTLQSIGATGMGLAIARHIVVEKFGGTLACESKPGAGSTFTATFPHCTKRCLGSGAEPVPPRTSSAIDDAS